MSEIHRFSLVYDIPEDRIAWDVEDTDGVATRLWLTQRLCRALLTAIFPMVQAPAAADLPSQHQATLQSWEQAAAMSEFGKVPAVTLGFWLIKILATTLGETAGDSVTMTLHAGYLVGSLIFVGVLAALVVVQIVAKRFHPAVYWATIVASTTAGTTLADFADRSLGIGYAGGSTVLLLSVLAVLGLWFWSEKTVSVDTVSTPRVEAFYWATITLSQTLGTALGDGTEDTAGIRSHGADGEIGAALAGRLPGSVKYWPQVGRVDNVHGDRNLFCSCVPLSEYDKA